MLSCRGSPSLSGPVRGKMGCYVVGMYVGLLLLSDGLFQALTDGHILCLPFCGQIFSDKKEGLYERATALSLWGKVALFIYVSETVSVTSSGLVAGLAIYGAERIDNGVLEARCQVGFVGLRGEG